MADNKISFLSFDEAVQAAKNEPGVEFIALQYVAPYTRLDVYVINCDPEEPDFVNVQYEGGELFDLGGEEDFYGLEEVPDEAKRLYYARSTDLGNGNAKVMGMLAEFALQEVLPGLSEADTYSSQADFIKVASAQFRSYWKQS